MTTLSQATPSSYDTAYECQQQQDFAEERFEDLVGPILLDALEAARAIWNDTTKTTQDKIDDLIDWHYRFGIKLERADEKFKERQEMKQIKGTCKNCKKYGKPPCPARGNTGNDDWCAAWKEKKP